MRNERKKSQIERLELDKNKIKHLLDEINARKRQNGRYN